MRNLFPAGTEMVQSEITALGARGPYRLAIHHGQGTIIEYFTSSKEALLRQAELEHLLLSARGATLKVDVAEKEPV
jgi:hypothetical protein